jgi:hypothetical protein
MEFHGEGTLTPEQEEEIGVLMRRKRCQFLSFWLFCGKSACRRTRSCAFDTDFCLAQVGPSVPEDVRNAVDEMVCAQLLGKSFEEMMAESRDIVLPYGKWLEKVRKIEAKGRADLSAS